jgi:hypothetical protein
MKSFDSTEWFYIIVGVSLAYKFQIGNIQIKQVTGYVNGTGEILLLIESIL